VYFYSSSLKWSVLFVIVIYKEVDSWHFLNRAPSQPQINALRTDRSLRRQRQLNYSMAQSRLHKIDITLMELDLRRKMSSEKTVSTSVSNPTSASAPRKTGSLKSGQADKQNPKLSQRDRKCSA
jgi:hypothetical protein